LTRRLADPQQDRRIGPHDRQPLGDNRPDDLARVEAGDERLTGLIELSQIAQTRARLAIEPHLLTQQGDEDHEDADRTRDSGQVPADGVPVRKQQEADEPQHPDEGRQRQKVHETVLRAGRPQATSPTPERPHCHDSVESAARPDRERREPARLHDQGRQERVDEEHHQSHDGTDSDATRDDRPPTAIREGQLTIGEVSAESDTGQGCEVAGEEEIRGDARVQARRAGVIGLRQDVAGRQQRGHPERHADGRRLEVLAHPVALQAEIADASGHQHERCVEDRDGVWDRKAVRRQKGGEEEDGLVRESQGRDEQEQDRDTLSWGRRMDGVIERFVRTSENRSLFFHHILNGGTIAGRSEVWVEPNSRSTVPEE